MRYAHAASTMMYFPAAPPAAAFLLYLGETFCLQQSGQSYPAFRCDFGFAHLGRRPRCPAAAAVPHQLGEVTPLGGRGDALREIAKIGTRSETAETGALPGLAAETRRGYGLHLKRRSF